MSKPKLRTPHDLRNLPDYVDSIDPKVRPLRRIVTGYYFNSEYPCGLKSCHQPHKEGFLVELEDGNFTNVGWKCGERFGERFGIERDRYAELELRPKAIQAIQEVIAKIQGMRDLLDELAADADRLSAYKREMRTLLPRLYPELERRAHTGNDRVTEQVERSEEEIEDLQSMNPGRSREHFRYREEPRGSLVGLRVLASNIRDDVITKLTLKAADLVVENIGALSIENLLEWERWALNFDDSVERSRAAIAAGNAFFSTDNFRRMSHIATDRLEKATVSQLTVEAFLTNAARAAEGQKETQNPISQSKKRRDLQKRVEALRRRAKRC